MQTDSYKSRTQSVRRSARAHLIELRKARLAQRAMAEDEPGLDNADAPQSDREMHQAAIDLTQKVEAAAKVEEGPETPEDPDGDAVADMALRNAAMAEMSEGFEEDTPTPTDPGEPEAAPDANPDAVSAEVEASETLPEPDPLAPSPDDAVETEEVAAEAAPDASELEAAPAEDQASVEETGEEWRDSPLASLPGAGPGLVWMLNQCNVRTLEDLAAQDSQLLSQKLGVVGQILDVSRWIELAQGAQPSETG